MWIPFRNEIFIATASKFEFNGISVESYLSEITMVTPSLAWFSFTQCLTKVSKCLSVERWFFLKFVS